MHRERLELAMRLKQKGYCSGVFLIYTVSTITSAYSSQTSPPLALHNDRNSGFTAKRLTRPPSREGTGRLHLDSRRGEEWRNLPPRHDLESGDGTQAGPSGGRPERTLRPRMASPSGERGFRNRDKPKQTAEGEGANASLNPPNDDCSKGTIKHVIHGKFTITGQLDANLPNAGYQSDSAASVQAQRGQRASGSAESWQRLRPVVVCGDDAMTLTVRRRRAVQLLLDRVNESSVPLSQLPPQCGYSVQTTWRDLSLMAQYEACHVSREGDSYVLPLLWRGTPVKMSCSASGIQPQTEGPSSLCCSPFGLTFKVQGVSATEELRVNVRGEWTPLVVLAEQCGYTWERRDAEVLIAAPFITCGVTVKDGKYTLSLQIGEKMFTLACPVSHSEELPLTRRPPLHSPHHPVRSPTEPMPQSLELFPWAPPFYLAPPYYPHPTYHHKYPSPSGLGAHNLPDPTFGPQPLPSVNYQDYYSHQIPMRESYKHSSDHGSLPSTDDLEDLSQVYPDLQQKQETPVSSLSEKHNATRSPSSDAGFPTEVAAPPLRTFNQYYHYYHLPKIPLPGPPQDPDPGPEVPRALPLTNPHNAGFPALPVSVQQSVALSTDNSDRFLDKAPAPYTAHPPQPYPYHYFYYFPHIARGEAKSLALPNPDKTAKTAVSDRQNTKSSALVHPLPRSSEARYKYNLNPDEPKPDKMISFQKNGPEWTKPPFLSEGHGPAELQDHKRPSAVQPPPPLPPTYPPKQPSSPTPSPNLNPPHPYYYVPYYHYYQMYHGPESLLSADNQMSPTSSKAAVDPLLQTSSSPPQHLTHSNHETTTPPKTPMYDIHYSPLHPYYYYYHLYYQPEVSADNQGLNPTGGMNSDDSLMYWPVRAAEAGYPSIPQSLHSIYSHYMTQLHPYNTFGLDKEIKDHLKANPYTPSASPSGLGPVSDSDCSVSSGCCSYPVNACTMGQHLIFMLPDSVAEPTVAPPAHPSEVSNVSCTLQRLTSNPDLYIVPLDGCGVNKQVFGQTVVHQLEVRGIHSQDRSSVHESSPVRLMVECSSSPGAPGEVRLHVMDEPPPPPVHATPATVTVQLRISTDQSFTSFHPDAHLPLSAMQGRPLYVEVSLLDPPEPGLVLLVHSCLAYTLAPYASWMLIYDACSSQDVSRLLPPARSDLNHIQKIMISSFLSLPPESPPNMAKGGHSHLEDPEIYFLCLTEVCSAADGDCTVDCINSPSSDVSAMQ